MCSITLLLELLQYPLTFICFTEESPYPISNHLISPQEFDALCPFDLNTETCFDRYTMKLLEKSKNSKRALKSYWHVCPPGEDGLTCFDRYVDNIRLLKKNTKRAAAPQCQPGENRMLCFDKYISSMHLRETRSQLCPPGESKINCFDKYISDMKLVPSYGKRGAGSDQCIMGERSLECLDRYIKAIKTKDANYLSKRGVKCEPGANALDCFDQYVNQVKLAKAPAIKRHSIDCAPGENDIACFDRHISNVKLLKKQASKRAAMFQCDFGEDDLSCFDRYITQVKLLPSSQKRFTGCGPMDDNLACMDKYISEIRLHRSMKKRSVDCIPGEDTLSCFDRHASYLRLRATKSKRFAPSFSDCAPGDSNVACLDKYISSIRLNRGLSQKRQSIECEPGSYSIACLDQYIGNMKLLPQQAKRSSSSFCAPGEDGMACFDRYVQNIKVKSPHHMKRMAYCEPGQNVMQCFDQYINHIKIKHSSLIKRSPIYCPPGEDGVTCFDQYVQEIKTKDRRDAEESLLRSPRPEAWRHGGLSLRSQTFQRCPPSVSRVQCFNRYMAQALRTLTPTSLTEEEPMYTDEDVAEEEEELEKRAGSFCPSAMDNVECFHQYLSKWVISANSPPKRTFRFGPGKKRYTQRRRRGTAEEMMSPSLDAMTMECSVRPSSTACLKSLMSVFIEVADITTEYELDGAIHALCESSQQADECEETLNKAVNRKAPNTKPHQEWNDDNELDVKDRDERSICPSGQNQVRCFESLLHAYMHKVVPKGSTEFVGKRR